VITLAVVETGLQVLCIIKNRVVVDVRMLHRSYKNEPWGKEYWWEYRSAGYHYEPFVLWNANPFQGKWINIDQDTRRKTWRPPGTNPPNPEEIYVLGGSLSGASVPGMITRFPPICQNYSIRRTINI
jgi:hypothetical protein